MLSLFSPIVLLCISMVAGLLGGCSRNEYSKKNMKNSIDATVFSLLTLVFSLCVLLLLSDSLFCSFYTFLLGGLFGILVFASTYFGIQALNSGPMALTTMLTYAGCMLIPAFSGMIFWQESISLVRWIGIGLMMVMLPLTIRGDNQRTISLRWLIYCGISCLIGGAVGILQKVHQTSEYKQELDGFLMISFVGSILANAVLLLLEYRKGERISNSFSPTKKGFWLVLLAGIGIAIPNKFNLYLSGVMDSAVFFPLVNGGGLLLNLLAAVILFREHPTKMQLVGFVIGMVAILLLGM